MLFFLLSLLAGVLTVLAPCTISLLPVIVGGSIGSTNAKRALTVTVSLGMSVIIFTLLLKFSSSLVAVPQEVWQLISGGIIFVLGLTMLIPALWEKLSFVGALNRRSNRLLAVGYQRSGFVGDALMGAALGPVFSSCSPTYFLILAAVLPRSVPEGLIYLLAYTLGLCVTLLVIAVASQRVLARFGLLSDPRGRLKRWIGVLFLILGLAIAFGYDKKLERVFAGTFFDVTRIEQFFLMPSSDSTEQKATTTQSSVIQDMAIRERAKAAAYDRAPEITHPSGFINTDGAPITLEQYRGKKVVLVDFWTYSCINCQRTLPYLKAWYAKYHDQGLEIVSIHTPEFAFEKVPSNVEAAARDFGLLYPIVLDNDYGTWTAFKNQYWPRKYLIDIDGFVVYDHAGEGSYEETEEAIQRALAERATLLGEAASMPDDAIAARAIPESENGAQSPETYFGAFRNEYPANGTPGETGTRSFKKPASLSRNALYLDGTWAIGEQYAESVENSTVLYWYNAKEVYIVGDADAPTAVEVLQDGKPVGAAAGADVDAAGMVHIRESRLYKLVKNPSAGSHVLELRVKGAGVRFYAFTFG